MKELKPVERDWVLIREDYPIVRQELFQYDLIELLRSGLADLAYLVDALFIQVDGDDIDEDLQ